MKANVIFVVGRCESEKEYCGLMDYLTKFYRPRLPGIPFDVTRWDKDVLGFINQKAPAPTPLVLVGFSFGGGKAVEVCSQLQRPIKKLVLIDPVNPVWWGPDARPKGADGKPLPLPWSGAWTGNTWDFVIPANVQSVHCFYREAKQMPWSAPIRSARIGPNGRCEITNIKYTPTKANPIEAHGEYVWRSETIEVIKAAAFGA